MPNLTTFLISENSTMVTLRWHQFFLFTFPYLGMNFQKLNLMKNMDKPTFFDWKSYFGLKEDILKCFCSQRGLKMAKKEMFSPWLPVNYEEHSYQNWQYFSNIYSAGIFTQDLTDIKGECSWTLKKVKSFVWWIWRDNLWFFWVQICET